MLYTSIIESPLGDLRAIADKDALLCLEFTDCKNFEGRIAKLKKHYGCDELQKSGNEITQQIAGEIEAYFNGTLKAFKTPVKYSGTDFQASVWDELCAIPHGATRSYAELANALGKPKGYRAVARANATNVMAIIVPCHRVINKGGALGGYNGGLDRKKWLLDHEEKMVA